MVTRQKIEAYIAQIPPLPQTLMACNQALQKEDLPQASEFAAKDPALVAYLRHIVNKPFFGFRGEVKDPKQIFGILGLLKAKQIIHSYMVTLLTPKQWHIFALDDALFQELQAQTMVLWEYILEAERLGDHALASAATLFPAAVIVAEQVLAAHREDLQLLQSVSAQSHDQILRKLTGMGLFDIAAWIAQKWELPQAVIDLFGQLGRIPEVSKEQKRALQFLHLLLFYLLSKPEFIDAGLNGFIDFDGDFVESILPHFEALIASYETSRQG